MRAIGMTLAVLLAFTIADPARAEKSVYHQTKILLCPAQAQEECEGNTCTFQNVVIVDGKLNKSEKVFEEIDSVEVRWTKTSTGKSCEPNRSGGKGRIKVEFAGKDKKSCELTNTYEKCDGFSWRTAEGTWSEPSGDAEKPVKDPSGFRVKAKLTSVYVDYQMELSCACGREAPSKFDWKTELEVRQKVRGRPHPVPE